MEHNKSSFMFQEPVDEYDNEAILLFSDMEDLQQSQTIPNMENHKSLNNIICEDEKKIDAKINFNNLKIQKYIEICNSRIKYFNSCEGKESYPHEYEDLLQRWNLEKNTWDLAKSIYSIRMYDYNSALTVTSSNLTNYLKESLKEIKTDYYKVQKIFEADKHLAESLAIKTWLENSAPKTRYIETRPGYWPFTKKEIEISNKKSETNKTLVTQLDPDATTRQQKNLAFEDQEYERLMFQSLFDYLRRGKLRDAMLLCIKNDEPWRAASLRGGMYFFDNNIDNNSIDSSLELSASNNSNFLTGGNINRELWKYMCSAIACDNNRNIYERSLYGILSGRLDEALTICNTWEDVLWAEITCMIEQNLSNILLGSENMFEAVNTQSLENSIQKATVSSSLADIFFKLNSYSENEIKKQISDPFREVQAALMNDNFNDYIKNYAADLRDRGVGSFDLQFLRFLVHLILITRQYNQPIDEMAGDSIISSYVQALSLSESHKALIALYASKLPGNLPNLLYSEFLTKQSDGVESRLIYIQLAEQYKLNTNFIVKNTALRILENHCYKSYNDVMNNELEISNVDGALTLEEVSLIRAIEWLNFYPYLYSYSLLQVVSLVRKFMIYGRVNAAVALFNSLPDNFVQSSWRYAALGLGSINHGDFSVDNESFKSLRVIDQSKSWGETLKLIQFITNNPELDSSDIDYNLFKDTILDEDSETQQWPTAVISTAFYEYIQLLSLCDGIIAFNKYKAHMKDKPHSDNKSEWFMVAIDLTNSAENIIRQRVLEADWLGSSVMLFEKNSTQTEYRNFEIELLRKQYIPYCVFSLHDILFESHSYIPRNLKRSLDIAQLVADDTHNISGELTATSNQYPNGKMHKFLQLIRKSALEMLKEQEQ
ncbi:hypothetical protein BB561_002152 [Smittium simulii]|uniref:Nuclear pore complex protein n=1 Tax=Smittium simulii TaxID=133385 RepID=A0A2T9YRH3_9FUNG|nr:hypothetical protein BB561_002152 [Smittium simulii]